MSSKIDYESRSTGLTSESIDGEKAWAIRQSKLYKPDGYKEQLREIKADFLKFILTPNAHNEELVRRDFEFNKLKSKRKFASKLNNPLTIFGILIITTILIWVVFAPWIVSEFPFSQLVGVNEEIPPWAEPNSTYILGTSKFGRDVYGRLIWGARSSITMGLFSLTISSVFGVMLGIYAAYQGGIVDNIIMRVMDIIMAFPGLIIVIIILSIVGTSMQTILIIFGFLGIPGYARLIRGSALQEIGKTYVEAAKVAGTKSGRIMFKHVLPNCIAPVVVAVTFNIGGMILGLAGLAFLGFNDPTLIEWGNDINIARDRLYNAIWAALVPGVGIFITVLGFMLFGDGLRDAMDPRIQGHKQKKIKKKKKSKKVEA
ncbi:hypothetical protein NEF87_001626 [Candidatus Lokiarchaeum ossiferum]|uniref:ABC transmembrane type-1 domain-containing protein n=1 Tax=Candidatus Lokiarchaeum ossiferum TaxID=2951803 RepID=A0ABY6HP98_9ARCH|nr:hypothetical protein NEF87_001626 [Candidatus Lokiarchaeum sp. B-35]